ncbi:MAG: hypothetical protein WCK15_20710 [Pirellula sp.]
MTNARNDLAVELKTTVRRTTSKFLGGDALEKATLKATCLRDRELLNWLRNQAADIPTLVDWLNGDGFVVMRNESPSEAIRSGIAALESESKECVDDSVRGVFVQRMAEALDWLASESSIRSELGISVWIELFDLANHLCYPEWMSRSVANLRRAIENDAVPPYPMDHDVAYQFTRLVSSNQVDNELQMRWMNVIEKKADPVLSIDLLGAMEGLLSMPLEIDFDVLEEAHAHFCKRVDASRLSDDDKQQKANCLQSCIEKKHLRYSKAATLILAKLSNDYPWMPRSNPMVIKIAVSRDPAVLSNLAKVLGTECASLARLMYEIQIRRGRFPFELREYVRRNSEASAMNRMVVGREYNSETYLKSSIPSIEVSEGAIMNYVSQC